MREWLLAGSAAVALMGGAALAQPDTENGENAEVKKDVITVYGTSNPLPAFDYPGQVTVIDRDQIDMISPSTISDMLRDVPGVDFSGGPRRTGEFPTLRGLTGENVLILVDGARQSFISAHDGRFFLDPELISQAEVVQGPASALYGSGAVGGVLAFETADAADFLGEDESWGGRVRLGYQSVNEEQMASFTGYTKQGAFDGLANLALRKSGDIELGSGADLSSDDDIQTGMVKLGYQWTDAFRSEASWQRFSNTAIEPNNGQGSLGTGDSTLDQDVEKDITTDTYRLGLDFNPASDLIDGRFTVYGSSTEVEETDATIPRVTTRRIETTGVSARNASRFELGGLDLTFTMGGDWYKDEQTGKDDQTGDGSRGGVPNGESEFIGAFAQLEANFERPFGLPGSLLVIPGIRYDSFESSSELSEDENSDEQTSPRMAASYAPVEWLRLFGSYSEGFRAPSINELYLDGVHFEVPHPILFDPAGTPPSFVFVNNNFIPNPDLIPEKVDTTEFGVGVDFHDVFTGNDRFQAKISRYESDAEDLVNLFVDFSYDATCFAPPFFPCTAGTTYSSNVDGASLEGVEATAFYTSERFFARLSYGTVDGQVDADGSDLGTLTPDRFSADAGLIFPSVNATIGTRIQVSSDFERRTADGSGGFDAAEEREGYTVADIYASWRPDFAPGFRIDAGVDNVFDEDYERVFEGVSEPARNYKLSVTYQFAR